MNDQVDILLATYNGEAYIQEQLESLLNQTHRNIRIIVSDDGSTDKTVDIIREFSIRDARITLDKRSHRFGCAKDNFFYLLSLAESEFIMFCDQDDVWIPEKVSVTLRTMQGMDYLSKPCLVYSDMKVVSSDLNVISDSFLEFQDIERGCTDFWSVLAQPFGAGCTMMINRQTKNLALKGKNNQNVRMHDHWCSLVASAFGEICFIDSSLMLYRLHSRNCVGAVRYSPLKILCHPGRIIYSVHSNVKQAEEFSCLYFDRLSEDQKSGIEEVTKLLTIPRWKRPLQIALQCRFWNRGFLKRCGEFFALVMM